MKATTTEGSLLFNASLYTSDNKNISKVITILNNNMYHVEKIEKVHQTNTLLIAKLSD